MITNNTTPFKSIFDESFLHAARFENESYEDYKKRQKANMHFWKMYRTFGRERFMKFMEFMEEMGKDEPETGQDAK